MTNTSSSGDRFWHFLRPHKTIPITPWRAKNRWDLSPKRVLILFFGLFIFGLGDSLLIQSNTGNAPWTVFAQGLSKKIDISIGWSTFLISAVILLLWFFVDERPGFGTLSNIVIIASAIEFGVTFIPESSNYVQGIAMDFLGVGMVGVGSALYITCGLGPGPRDGLMTGIHNSTGIRIGRVRLGIEGSALACGVLLGGHVGLGTAIFALFIGQSIAVALGVVARLTSR